MSKQRIDAFFNAPVSLHTLIMYMVLWMMMRDYAPPIPDELPPKWFTVGLWVIIALLWRGLIGVLDWIVDTVRNDAR